MATAFRRTTAGRYVARFEPDELHVVIMLLEQTRDLLQGGGTGDGVGAAAGSARVGPATGGSDEDEFEHLMRSAGWIDGAPPVSPARIDAPDSSPESRPLGANAGTAGLGGGPSPEPLDPALRRLLPDPNLTDPQASAEFRRLTGAGLRERKAATIHTAILALTGALAAAETGSGASRAEGSRRRRRPADVIVELDPPRAQALMIALTDVRLVLGERLQLHTEDDADKVVHRLEHSLDPEDPLVAMAFAYDFLTWLQESLTQALLD